LILRSILSAQASASFSEGKVLILTMLFVRTSARKFPFAKGLMYAITRLQQRKMKSDWMIFWGSLRRLIEQS
jgi:hypothetical protein